MPPPLEVPTASAPDPLKAYRSRRAFERTPEPSGDEPAASVAPGLRFVVQKHGARRLHYDFRLELQGVLLSWAVPKGPSLSPGVRRLAARTEDHPLDYAGFEGVIPPDQYGAGPVEVWDRGTWMPEGDPREGMERGRLTFALSGEKLRGRFHLVRIGTERDREMWLLFKGRDEHASEEDIVATRPESAITGRTLDEIAAATDAVWKASRPPKDASPAPPTQRSLDELVASLPVRVALTHLDKVLYPDDGITKAALVAYLALVADRMLPQIARRPLTLVRCPEGRHEHCFFQKHARPGIPDAIRRVPIAEGDGTVAQYMMLDDLDGLVAAAQLGALELHTWGCHTDDVERPDQLVLDLDPDEGLPWDAVVEAALDLRERLADLGLETFVKTTGGKGLHVVAPVRRRIGWDDFKAFAKGVAEQLASSSPDRFTTSPLKARRRGKIFVDYLRNARGATSIAAYSPRARPGAPVATPLTWDELQRGIDPAGLTIASLPARLRDIGADPWRGYAGVRQSITAAARRKVRSAG